MTTPERLWHTGKCLACVPQLCYTLWSTASSSFSLFKTLSDITTKTWSKRTEDLSRSAILHLKAENGNTGSDCVLKQEREINKMAKSLPKFGNTVILKNYLELYADDWASHLKLIADFLKPGELEGVVEKDGNETTLNSLMGQRKHASDKRDQSYTTSVPIL